MRFEIVELPDDSHCVCRVCGRYYDPSAVAWPGVETILANGEGICTLCALECCHELLATVQYRAQFFPPDFPDWPADERAHVREVLAQLKPPPSFQPVDLCASWRTD